jgi:serine/threonine protein kinase
MPLNTGQVVEDRYRIAKLLGQGGMGAVYRAWDMRLNRPVALKEMVPQSSLDLTMLAQLRQQFQQEAQVLATLTHPSLVRVTDYFSWSNNEYLVMDFIEGESLAERIAREGAQPETQVIAWSGQLLDALAYCHGRGVLHRDIKPQNIVITPEGRAVLVDFGLVKLWDPKDPHTRTVMRGAGTPEYAPPEQYDIGAGHTDPRSDIYGLGATIYHALTGKAPRTATQRMASPSSFIPPRRINAAISEAAEAVVLKALEIAMEQRYQSANDMARALGIAPRPSPIAPRRATPEREHRQVMPAAKPERKQGALLGLGGIGLAVVGVLCLVLAAGTVVIGWILREGGKSLPPTLQSTATRFPTSTPRPTNTPPAESGGLLFQDDFSDSGSGWEVGDYDFGSVGYGAGYYYIISSETEQMMWGLAAQDFSDLTVEVDATQISGPTNDNNAYGIMCRVQPNDDGYVLRVSGDGYYAIHRIADGEFEPLVDWAASDAIRQGNANNHITAVCDGTYLALFINGELLAEANDETFGQGDIALTATTYEAEPTEIHFDNLAVYAP